MAKQILTIDNADSTGSDETFVETTSSTLDTSETVFHFYNTFDVSVSVSIKGTRNGDDDGTEGVEIDSQSLTSGGDSVYYTVTEPWDQVHVTLSPGGDPTTGSLTVNRMDGN